ncbi:MAG: hydroxyacylglutathione hydrolase [Proteobacteria bacterium]|nr:hydroxyacylglutathione hydrolase [Pseudomonadota bacterium]
MKHEFKIIADLIENNSRVIDVGCGDGVLMDFLKKNKNIDVRGLELSKEKVQKCISKGLTVIEGNAESDLQQFPNHSFDYAILSQTLQAFLNPEIVINELLRVGKKAIVTIPNFGYWKVRFHLLFRGTMPITETLPDQWYNTANLHMCTIKDCLQDNYSYLIIDENQKIACAVDPSESQPISNFIDQNNIKLKYILNTHHHYDHVGGNNELKKKYNCKIIGFRGDKNRIPEIDIMVDDNEIWKSDNFQSKIIHIPGHTSGHICYYFFNEKIIFTGDTLFSLGCGRIFEGTYNQMFNSLNKLKKLPQEIKIYCGHEYTLKNSEFCLKYDPDNLLLKKKIIEIKSRLNKNLPTLPSTIKDELECNIFLKAKDLENFSKLRDLKDNF